MEHLGELEELVETFLGTYAIATSHDDGSTLEVVLGGLHMMVEDTDDESLRADILRDLWVDHFLAALALVDGFLHDARTDGGHLRTVVGVDNRGHDVATKGGTNLIEQIVVVLLGLGIVVGTNLQLCAVGGQSAGQRRRHAGSEVAADDRGAHQADLGVLLLEEVHEDVGVGSGCVGEQSFAIEDEELVDAIGQDLLFHLVPDARSGHHGMELHPQLIGQFATLRQQLLRHFLHERAFYLYIYKYGLTPSPSPRGEGSGMTLALLFIACIHVIFLFC